jgi:hypothetical protein
MKNGDGRISLLQTIAEGGRGKALGGSASSGGDQGTWRNRRPVEGLRERIGRDPIDGRRGGLRFVEGARQTKLEFWQVPMRQIRQKAERSKVVKTQ